MPILSNVFKAMLSAVRFWWLASAGNRLRPWRSPYLRWRMETYSGIPAAKLTARDFLRIAYAERRQMSRFFLWSSELNEQAREPKK